MSTGVALPARRSELEILRPVEALAEVVVAEDGLYILLEIHEWNLVGWARLVGIQPCPAVEPGPGRIVMMKSTTDYAGPMARITIAGTGEALVGTHDHPIFSEDRGIYAPLGDLVPGERVRTADGWAMVESLARWWGQQEVHNLEVDVEHRFYVGHAGVESHNANPCGGASPAPGRGGPYGHLDDPASAGTGKAFTPAQKKKILEENQARNGGVLKDDRTGEALARGQQSQRGVTPPGNEAQVDHVYPRSKGGPNTYSNAEVRSRANNIRKSNNVGD